MTKVSERVKAVSESASPEMMRAAIRAKLRAGTSKQTIYWLISTYAPPGSLPMHHPARLIGAGRVTKSGATAFFATRRNSAARA